MNLVLRIVALLAAACCILAAGSALAELEPLHPIRVTGLVVSTATGMVLNDGDKDYLLQGVDDIGLEGKVCEIYGDLIDDRGTLVIDVYDIHLIMDDYPTEDPVGLGGQGDGFARAELICGSPVANPVHA